MSACFYVSFYTYTSHTYKTCCFLLSPVCPQEMDWSELYPDYFPGNPSEKEGPRVEFADIGCGYGGLLGTYVADLTT